MNLKHFVITLPEQAARTALCRKHFDSVGMKAEFFHGLHADTTGLITLHNYEVDAPNSGFNMGGKPAGIWLSHYMIWSALQYVDATHFHIMESDVKLPDDWSSKFEDALVETPSDFDMLYTGSCCCAGHKREQVGENVWKILPPNGPQCLHSYIVAKTALPVLLATQRKVYAPIDIALVFHTHSMLKVFCVLPRIADQFDTVFPP